MKRSTIISYDAKQLTVIINCSYGIMILHFNNISGEYSAAALCSICNGENCSSMTADYYQEGRENDIPGYITPICQDCIAIFKRLPITHENPDWITRAVNNAIDYAFMGDIIKKMQDCRAKYQIGLYVPIMHDIRAIILRYYIELWCTKN